MSQLTKLLAFVALIGLTGCFAFNQDWTKKPATKTDYIPGQYYQLLTNVYFSTYNLPGSLSSHPLGGSDSLLDAGTRLRVTTVHFNGDSFEMGFYTTVCAEVINGPFKGTNFDISFLSEHWGAFIARNPKILEPVDASSPDLNTNHFASVVRQVADYRGEYSWDWWQHCEEKPDIILPLVFLLNQKQSAMLLDAYEDAATPEGKAYALAALRRLDDPHFASLAQQLTATCPTIKTFHGGIHAAEPTASVMARMKQDVEMLCPRP